MPSDGQGETLARDRPAGQKQSGRGPQGRIACRTCAARKEMGRGPKVVNRGMGRAFFKSQFFPVFLFFQKLF